ncbi:MAG: hypothetical protein NXI10_12890 [bacterium]|nr:hypothetical protein [bacterium]
MKQTFLYILALLVFTSCSSEETEADRTDQTGEKSMIQNQVTDFSESEFDNPKSLEILKELDICVLQDSLGIVAECSPKNFKIIPFKNNVPMEDAFILEVKAGILLKGSPEPLPPIRHIIVFERENGELVQVNGFRGDLIAKDVGKDVNDIILALYVKADETLFHCRYAWNGDKFEFKSVDGLDYGDGVKTLSPATKDSVTNEIYGSIMQSNLIF